jgi:inner membrane protein
MDTITHGLLGAAVAQLGLRQRIGRDATWVAAAAAVVPDLDVLVEPLLTLSGVEVSPVSHVLFHRSYSHSLLLAPPLALVIALLWWRSRRARSAASTAAPPSFVLLYGTVLLAVLSQPLLDLCTSYGTPLLLPLSDRRFALDAVAVVDIIYTPLLILTLAGCWLARRRQTEADAGRRSLVVAWVGLLIGGGYLAAGRLAHGTVIDRARAQLAGHELARVEAYPIVGTIFLWRVVAESQDRWIAMRVHLWADPKRPFKAEEVPKQRSPWIARARRLPEARTFDWFAMGMTRATTSRQQGQHLVEIHDMRYPRRIAGVRGEWALRVALDDRGRVTDLDWIRHHYSKGYWWLAKSIWHEIWNP